jgi:hypothetical protein
VQVGYRVVFGLQKAVRHPAWGAAPCVKERLKKQDVGAAGSRGCFAQKTASKCLISVTSYNNREMRLASLDKKITAW